MAWQAVIPKPHALPCYVCCCLPARGQTFTHTFLYTQGHQRLGERLTMGKLCHVTTVTSGESEGDCRWLENMCRRVRRV